MVNVLRHAVWVHGDTFALPVTKNRSPFKPANGGAYIIANATDRSAGHADIFVPNVTASAVKAQTHFNL